MTLSEALSKLRSPGLPVLRSADVAAYLSTSPTNSSAIMARLAKHGHVVRIKRGLWAFAEIDPLVTVPYLTAPLPSYVSLQSALYYHGMTSQIPELVFCVSLARARSYTSALGTVSVHHIPGCFFFGYADSGREGVAMASPEKALLDFLYLGRGICYPIALEGALKLKEISYIHAEGYPAGEMKHGPIALIDDRMPVVVLASNNDVFEKVLSNMEEVRARGGRLIALTEAENSAALALADAAIMVPPAPPLLAPILLTVPLQLLAYHVAVLRGTDVDQPRNLAKTVTVE